MFDGRWYWKAEDTALGTEGKKVTDGEHKGKIIMKVHPLGNPGDRRVFLASLADNNRRDQQSLQPLGAIHKCVPSSRFWKPGNKIFSPPPLPPSLSCAACYPMYFCVLLKMSQEEVTSTDSTF